MMHFQIGGAVRSADERRYAAASFTCASCPKQRLGNYIRVPPECRRGHNHSFRKPWSKSQSGQSLLLGELLRHPNVRFESGRCFANGQHVAKIANKRPNVDLPRLTPSFMPWHKLKP
ncbi:hypothetical protein LMG27177_01141 [Paraburkholderia fynbosensis]|uniref:Uncharacterized protein n=1 Tax=Paraburkholderia fynbosensis TaxID=1200993 RepID=A0A6J5FKS1_9BURK|nr:hypothetical protein LMG27177_01141 [Paraburkholderia fynbosensis]